MMEILTVPSTVTVFTYVQSTKHVSGKSTPLTLALVLLSVALRKVTLKNDKLAGTWSK